MLEIKDLRIEYPGVVLLDNINATIKKGDVVCIIGPSGSGKSKLIRSINLLERPSGGQIIFCGKDILQPGAFDPQTRIKMGMVFQSYNLFPHMTVIENVMYAPVHKMGLSRKEAYERSVKYLERVGMAERLFSYPDELSGGQMQRAEIARALAMEPELILLDEPTSALDPSMAGEVETVIKGMAKAGATMIIVTHSMKLAKNVANRIFYIDEKSIYEEGTPEEIFNYPKREKTRIFVDRSKTLEIFVKSRQHDFIGSLNDIQNFVRDFGLAKKTIAHIETIFEEVCVNIISAQSDDNIKINMALEYSEDKDHARMTFKFITDSVDFREIADEISLKLIENAADIVEDGASEDSDYTNILKLEIK